MLVGLFVYRRLRNRRQKLVRRFVARLRKLPEVRLICLQENNLSVVVDQAQAATYARVHAHRRTGINHKLYFGAPLTGTVREDVAPAELAQTLQRPGVLFVRPADIATLVRTSGTRDN